MSPVGVTVTTDVLQPSGGPDLARAASFFVVGITERGDTTAPVMVRNMAEAQTYLGSRVSYGAVFDQLQAYFGEGGSRAYIARVVGGAATKGTVTLPDGSAVNTLRFDAQNAGAWSSTLQVQVDPGTQTSTYKVTVLLAGTAVEVHDNLANPAAAVSAFVTSPYVRATDLASGTAAPGNNPATVAATPLSAGNDDRGTVNSAAMVTALTQFSPDLGPGAVAIPGQPSGNVGAGLIAHATANRRVALLAAAQGTSVASAVTAAKALRNTAGAESAGFVHPWVQIPDGAGGVRTISPEGFAAGVRARSIVAGGAVTEAPFGEAGKAQFITGAEVRLQSSEASTLADGAVSPIRVMLGGTRLYDWRSLSADEANWRFLTYRDMINDIAYRASLTVETFLGRDIDAQGKLFSELENALTAVVEPYHAADGLYELRDTDGNMIDPGYRVLTASPINTPTTIQAGQVNARVELRPSPSAETIGINISKATTSNTL